MTIGIYYTIMNSLSYSAATAIIRYIHVKNSLQVTVQEVIKRNAFIYKSIFIVESLGCFNLYSLYMMQRGKKGVERLPFLVYQTCLDPNSNYTSPSPSISQIKEGPIIQFMLIQAANGCIIYFNVYLYKYLDKQSKENTGKGRTQGPSMEIFVLKMVQRCGVCKIVPMSSLDQDQLFMKSKM